MGWYLRYSPAGEYPRRVLFELADTDWYEPTLIRNYWSTGLTVYDMESAGYGNKDGQALTVTRSSGMTEFTDEDGRRWYLRPDVPCEAGLGTQEPYPCPPVRAGIETRYRDGRWEKLLRAGWVRA